MQTYAFKHWAVMSVAEFATSFISAKQLIADRMSFASVKGLDKRQLSHYYRYLMIKAFKHRGLKRLYERGDRSGIRPDLLDIVEDILARLDEADIPHAMNLPGYKLHPLKGDMKGLWSITVRANWRIVFRFEGNDVFDVELIDYH